MSAKNTKQLINKTNNKRKTDESFTSHVLSKSGKKIVKNDRKLSQISAKRKPISPKVESNSSPKAPEDCAEVLANNSGTVGQRSGTAAEQQFKCYSNDCNQCFNDLNDLFRHLETNHNCFECHKCYESFSSKDQLLSHIKVKHRNNEQLFECTFCSLKCFSMAGLKLHIKSHARESVNTALSQSRVPADGVPNVSAPQTYKCFKCNQEFVYENRLKVHINRVHNKCLKCKKWFHNEPELLEHKISAHKERVHLKSTEEKSVELNTIVNNEKTGGISEPNPCETMKQAPGVNTKSTGKESNVKTVDISSILAQNSPEFIQTMSLTDFVCNECVLSFVSQIELLKHLGFVHKWSVFECNLCSFKTNTNSALISHRSSHSMERPYVCSECLQCFKGENHLFRHKKTVHSMSN